MGACCTAGRDDTEILEAKDMSELIKVVRSKKLNVASERLKVKAFMNDPKAITDKENLEKLSNEELGKRVKHLDTLEDALGEVANKLCQINKSDVEDAKEYANKIFSLIDLPYDEKNKVKDELAKFNKFYEKTKDKLKSAKKK